MTYLEIFNSCTSKGWKTSGKDVQWKIDSSGGLFFDYTKSDSDWNYNFKFMPKRMVEYPGKNYFVHEGFQGLWLSVKEEVFSAFGEDTPSYISGFSQGGAIASLAHDAFYNKHLKFPTTVIFGSPKVILIPPFVGDSRILLHFNTLHNIQLRGDIVPYAYPLYTPVGEVTKIGNSSFFSVEKHYPSAYRKALQDSM